MSVPVPAPLWLRRYTDEFLTLEEVGQIEGITREAVRQRLKRLGLEPRTLAETKLARERRAISLRSLEIRSKFLDSRNVDETASALNLPSSWVRKCLAETIPDYEVLARAPRRPSKKYTNNELFESLKAAAARTVGNLTAASYDEYVRAESTLPDGRARPGKQTMLLRYGSWREALLAAGLTPNPHSGPAKDFDEVAAVQSVVDYWRAVGGPPTVEGYDEWQRHRIGYPSSATIRKLTGSWNLLLVRAWQLVHGIVLDQVDDDVVVPAPMLSADHETVHASYFVPYRAAADCMEIALPSNLNTGEYRLLERAVRSHSKIQNEVARAASQLNLSCWSPAVSGPLFDLVLYDAESKRTFVVEVKSATVDNLEFQLRIGLGQVLRYAHALQAGLEAVVPVIAVELPPDEMWRSLLEKVGVGLLVSDCIKPNLETLINTI
ncbi:Sigma-70, region 4 [Rhodococcoides kroppenstedtii]|uniref:Sigma-70, region 4 n=1 Tax=Rhodococcoides kroppenstedtii TaxID=293050 RepID=A0A1I0TXD3_9NOCA|nr:sigma factor-like helix-turn-helix DNA-binding protein [Rhodococcus kroppenstedtii]SFA56422.1 Sigma-70, region 4 [Rhodococcus kroppenstedtii]